MKHEFDRKQFDECDEKARTWAKDLFKKKYQIDLTDNPDKFGIDLIASRSGIKVGYVEVDIKRGWGDSFMYTHLNVPVRKRKLLTAALKCILVTFNVVGSQCFICKGDVVINSEVEEVKNRHVPNGELFFKVPVNQIKLVTL